MEYLSGLQLKKVYERRLKAALSTLSDHSDETQTSQTVRLEAPLFSEQEVATIMKAVLRGLAPLHKQDHIHRDIKPENIILSPVVDELSTTSSPGTVVNADQSELKIVDFGFSAQYSVNQTEHIQDERIGTILFMAPELISQRTYGRVGPLSGKCNYR